jgi:hypothetical protein
MVTAEITTGKFQISTYRKLCNQAVPASTWVDYSMFGGNPIPNYYAATPLESKTLTSRKGIYHGEIVSPSKKYLTEWLMVPPTSVYTPMEFILCDYLMYYPFIDMDVTDVQEMEINDVLPRYTDGAGVKMFLVAQAPYIGTQQFFITYKNQNGVSKTSPTCASNVGLATSCIVSSSSGTPQALGYGPFIPLQEGDTGIRSVETITFLAPNGGLAALVLVKPLANLAILDVNAPTIKNFFTDAPSLPVIKDGAFLGLIGVSTVALTVGAPQIFGTMKFIWD